MKRLITLCVGVCLLAILFEACKKDVKEVVAAPEAISQETLSKIEALGFSTQNVLKIKEGYLVEGDIILTENDLNSRPSSPNMVIAQEEQYRTFNLVKNFPRTITVSVSGTVSSGFSNAVNAALARYNAENLQLTFQRVSSGGNIVIRLVENVSYIASAGFPSSQGNPYSQISYNKAYQNYSAGFMTTVIAHEMGHCIGFRHTDYMKRRYSCGYGGNEGQERNGVGAVHIPGTPTGPDANSWMLACLSSTTNRPFNANDKVALNHLY